MPATSGRSGAPQPGRRNRRPRGGRRLHTVDETSAGGLVFNPAHTSAVLIGRLDRKAELQWSLPKGHIEEGETAEQTAIREVTEETGVTSRVLGPLGTIDYWFVAEGRRIHKTVHHFLLEWVTGELSDEDVEVAAVAWVPADQLLDRLAYPDERKLVSKATEMLAAQRDVSPSIEADQP